MTVNEAIAEAKKLRPTALDDKELADMVRVVDDEVAEMMESEPNYFSWPEYDYELKLPAPLDRVYPLYLAAQIDLYNQEIALYQNDSVVYNSAIADVKAYYRRHNRVTNRRNWRI